MLYLLIFELTIDIQNDFKNHMLGRLGGTAVGRLRSDQGVRESSPTSGYSAMSLLLPLPLPLLLFPLSLAVFLCQKNKS